MTKICHDKSFIKTSILLSRQNTCLSRQMILVAAPANDTYSPHSLCPHFCRRWRTKVWKLGKMLTEQCFWVYINVLTAGKSKLVVATFVMAKLSLWRQKSVCYDKNSSRQAYFCRDKTHVCHDKIYTCSSSHPWYLFTPLTVSTFPRTVWCHLQEEIHIWICGCIVLCVIGENSWK